MVTTQKHLPTSSLNKVIRVDVLIIASHAMIDDRMLWSMQGLLLSQF